MNFLTGDFRFFWTESLKDFANFPTAWDSSLNNGIGISQLSSLWITGFFNFTAFFSKLGLSWSLIQLLFWILPAVLLSFLGSFFLFRKLFKLSILYAFLSGIVYTFNTYFLMIFTGGQLGVSLSYSIAPLVFLCFVLTLEKLSLKKSLIAGLMSGLQILLDPRITYITLFAVFLYLIFNFSKLRTVKNRRYLFFIFIIAVLVNSFWIFPLILVKVPSLPSGFDSLSSFKFFSFARLENSISLLHPNWPENIFGKVYFLRPEFLMFPIIAFSALLFKKNKNILFFSLLSLIGIFLAKGANEPFGFINEFLFQHIPGMKMFRDSTKWYLLITLGYSILIPFSVASIYELLGKHLRPYFKNVFLIIIIIYFALIAYSTLYYRFANNPKPNMVPDEYAKLKNLIANQQLFFRTLWVPEWQRFGFFSNNHPAIGRHEIFGTGTSYKTIENINRNKILLQDISVKYVIVPYDSQEEIFLKDRKYDERLYLETIKSVRKITWLKELKGFGKIAVFEVSNPKDHFYIIGNNLLKDRQVEYEYLNPTEYKVTVEDTVKGDILVFSESFDTGWVARNGINVKSREYNNLNSFILPKDGTYSFTVYYEPQKWVNVGLVVSSLTLTLILIFLGFGYLAKK